MNHEQLVEMTANIAASHVAHNKLGVDETGDLIGRIYEALSGLGMPPNWERRRRDITIAIRASVRPDHLICLVCRSKQTMLKAHLRSQHAMTPYQYRSDYGLPADYPMVPRDYAKRRSELARSPGSGGNRRYTSAAIQARKHAPEHT